MKCIFCKGTLVQKKVQEEVTVGNDHVLTLVDAEECENCHEKYFSSEAVDQLQKLREELKTRKDQFKVVGQVYQCASS